MVPISSGKQATETPVQPDMIDWLHVTGLQLWFVQHEPVKRPDAPAALDIAWMEAAGVRYAVVVIFEDDTWVWTDMTADMAHAKASIHRLSAQHDKPVQRGAQSCVDLRTAGY